MIRFYLLLIGVLTGLQATAQNQFNYSFLKSLINQKEPDLALLYLNNSLQKIIPFSKNVYMMSYSDNENALLSNMMKKQDVFQTKILKMKKCFHTIGTHFYYPLDEKWNSRQEFIQDVQTGLKDIYIIGEMISIHQGWTEGALQSVESILHARGDSPL
jgi:hypothetical protein